METSEYGMAVQEYRNNSRITSGNVLTLIAI